MSNSPEHNEQNPQSIPTAGASAMPAPSVHLGADKGKLIAAIPSLLGFPPIDSMVIIGLIASSEPAEPTNTEPTGPAPLPENHRRFRIGPVLRCDLNPAAVTEAVRGLTKILCDAPAAEAIILTVGDMDDGLRACVASAIEQLQEGCVEIQSALEVSRISTGEVWTDVLDGETGTVANVETNELADISALSGARRMGNREEMERWLDPANIAAPDWMLQDRGEATTVDLIQVLVGVAAVAEGQRVLEEECEDEYLIDSLAAICCDEFLHTVVIAWSLGVNSAILREMLASTARRTTGSVRRRVMLILALVASANDEGVLAYHTLTRLLEELEADLYTEDACATLDQLDSLDRLDRLDEAAVDPEVALEDLLRGVEEADGSNRNPRLSTLDEFTADLAIAALDAHQRGKIKLLLSKAVRAACTVMANVQMDLDAGEDPDDLREQGDPGESEGSSEGPGWVPERSYVTVREYAGLDLAWEYERLLQTVDWDAINAVRNATYHPVVR
ncbi:Uncharacterised protein [Corynebacterium jeikeium]|nr:DUF4192 family protein [Corynebacterium jeikeium]SQI20779.1 Uncharacterised protein [Corynebacterium jeikeium]SUY85383.1 Uncharacterised protein [Corynebacterium jeikeium]